MDSPVGSTAATTCSLWSWRMLETKNRNKTMRRRRAICSEKQEQNEQISCFQALTFEAAARSDKLEASTKCKPTTMTTKTTTTTMIATMTRLRSQCATCLFLLLMAMALLSCVNCVVVYQVRFLTTKTGRTDYVLAGESMELSCLHMMKDEAEDIKQLIWSKDGQNFLRWRKNKPGLEVLSYTFKGHVDPSSTHSHLIVHNTTIDMHGKYKCSVKTDLNTQSSEMDLVVISHNQCRFKDWRISSDQTRCRELLRLDCRQMFPRPVHSCGLWNSKTNKFIQSVTLDISEEPSTTTNNSISQPTQTYRVRYNDKIDLAYANGSVNTLYAHLLPFAGSLIFKCDILVPETSWRLSLMHKLFDFSDGCNQDPLETIEQLRSNFSRHARLRLLHQQQNKQRLKLDEIELLTTNLRYEILPPPSTRAASVSKQLDHRYQMIGSLAHNRTQRVKQQQELRRQHVNCWQRPRIGSLARLSCQAPQGDNRKLKLSGTNLLECRPNGWVPVSAASQPLLSSNELVDRSEATRRLQQQLKKAPRNQLSPRGSRATLKQDLNQTDLGSGNQERGENENEENDDDDDDSGLSTIATFVTNSNDELADSDNQIETIAAPSELSASELASLLPSCQLMSSQQGRLANPRQEILGSASDEHGVRKLQANDQDVNDAWLNWFSFSTSSAPTERSQWNLMFSTGMSMLITLSMFYLCQ